MHDSFPLMTTLVASTLGSFIVGMIAKPLKLPSILGYLVAGVLIGPHTPGFIGSVEIASQFSDVGVLLLMFGVGLHFSLKDLMSVRKIAIPGALIQVTAGTALGFGCGTMVGFTLAESLCFGFTLSIASTIVALRGLDHRGLLKSEAGILAVGWLIVEDIVAVVIIVLLPVLAPLMMSHGEPVDLPAVGYHLLLSVVKISGFATLVIVVGRRLLPPLLVMIVKTKSRGMS